MTPEDPVDGAEHEGQKRRMEHLGLACPLVLADKPVSVGVRALHVGAAVFFVVPEGAVAVPFGEAESQHVVVRTVKHFGRLVKAPEIGDRANKPGARKHEQNEKETDAEALASAPVLHIRGPHKA